MANSLKRSDSIHLDEIDRQILRLLRDDGRKPNAHIARAVGVSEPTVRKRLDRMIEQGVLRIVGYLDPQASGFPIDVVICLRVLPGRAREITKYLASLEHVNWVGHITGRYDVMIEAALRDHEDLLDFVTNEIGSIEGVLSAETFTVLSVEKFNFMWDLPAQRGEVAPGERRSAAGVR